MGGGACVVEDDKPKEECGVVGVFCPGEDAARKAYFALYALQHRGQESAGIATMGEKSVGAQMLHHKHTGLVSQVFNEQILGTLVGHMAVGHNRYATSGSRSAANAGPYVFNTIEGMIALSHNGNITNARALRERLLRRGVALSTNTDSELLALLLAAPIEESADEVPAISLDGGSSATAAPDRWVLRLQRLLELVQGAFSLTVLTEEAVYGVRDPLGLRPLCVGVLPGGGGHVIASESCALDTLGAQLLRDVCPAEVLRVDSGGLTSFMRGRGPCAPRALCAFEHVYFARPDSVIEGVSVHSARQALGRQLAQDSPELNPQSADVVVPVPDSSIAAALGFAAASGIAYGEGFTKSRYIGRTFIEPDQAMRRLGVRMKFNPLGANVRDRRVVLIDDSIVRGNTIGPLVALLRQVGAKEVHVRVSSPPVRHPCFMGVDMAQRHELVANKLQVERMAQHFGADSIRFLSESSLRGVLQQQGSAPQGARYCTACFSGNYPLTIADWETQ